MRIRLKHALVALIALVLLAMAYSPLLRSGLLAGDYEALLNPEATGAKALASLSLEGSRGLWGLPSLESPVGVGFALRMEHLLYVLLAGMGLGFFVRRLLLPWSGSEAAKAAGRAAALLFALHPLIIWSVADVAARAGLLALGLAIWSAFLFLKGRQDQRFGWLCFAYLLAVGAGFCSWLALGLPLLLAACDLTSTHRYRPLRTRARTAITTLVLFGVAVSLESVLARLLVGESGLGSVVESAQYQLSAGAAQETMGRCAAKLGLLVLPCNPLVLGTVGIAIAGSAFLLAIQPALLAARSAPRLWGWLLSGLVFALLVSLGMSLDVTVNASQLSGAIFMLPSIAVISAGLGLCSTALSGPHRPYMAWVVVIAYALLAHANARPWMSASSELAKLRRELVAPLAAQPGLRTVVLDVPLVHRGLPVVGEHMEVLLDPRLSAQRAGQPQDPGRPAALALDTQAFLSLLFEPEFRSWLGSESLIIYPRERMSALAALEHLGPRSYSVYHPLQPSTGERSWTQTLRSPPMDLSPIEHCALRVSVGKSVDPGVQIRVGWRSQATVQPEQGRLGGSWKATPLGALGWFDLGSSLAWRLGGRVRTMLFEEGLQSIEAAAVEADLPGLGNPRVELIDDALRIDGVKLPEGYGLGRMRFQLLNLSEFGVQVSDLESSATGVYQLPTAGRALRRSLRAGKSFAWVLEYSIEGHTVARQRGRF